MAEKETEKKKPNLSFTREPWFSAIIPMIVLIILLGIARPTAFFNTSNLSNVLKQAATYSILAVAMSFAIITGGIDLSMGSVLAVVAIVAGMIMDAGGGVFLAILAGLLVGAFVGFLNGLVIAYLDVPPFIMTLGTMRACRGLALLLTNASPIKVSDPLFRFFGTGTFLGIPVPVYLFIIVAVIGQYILSYTSTGRYIFAIGSNAEAARISGVNIKLYEMIAYIICGVIVAVGALMYMARLGAAQPTAGDGYELEAVAATVIGGTSIVGGEGSAVGSIFGAIVVAIIRNGMVLLEVSTYWQSIVIGLVIVVAVIVDMMRKKMDEKRVE